MENNKMLSLENMQNIELNFERILSFYIDDEAIVNKLVYKCCSSVEYELGVQLD